MLQLIVMCALAAQEPKSLCVDKCGDGVCQEMVCMGEGCPCAETREFCPADCKTSAK